MRQAFLTDICNQVDAINLSSEDKNKTTSLGHPSCKHQDWFDKNDDEIQRLPGEKHRLHKARQDDTSSVSKKARLNDFHLSR